MINISIKYQNWLRRQIAETEYELGHYDPLSTSRSDESCEYWLRGYKNALKKCLKESIRLLSDK